MSCDSPRSISCAARLGPGRADGPDRLGPGPCMGRAEWRCQGIRRGGSLNGMSRPNAQIPTSREVKSQGGHIMNAAIRWRIVSLQTMLVVILAGASGFLFYEGNFVTGMVHDQLVAQKIFFPGTDQIKAGGSL